MCLGDSVSEHRSLIYSPQHGDATPMLHYNGVDWQAAALDPVLAAMAASCRGGSKNKGPLEKR